MSDAEFHPAYMRAAQNVLGAFRMSDAELLPFAQAENLTFKLTRTSGSEYALRLHRPDYNTLQELESERAWTAALFAAGVAVQSSVFTAHGAPFVTLSIPELEESRYAGVTTWLPGETLARYLKGECSTSQRYAAFSAMGELAAGIHNQAQDWTPPRGFSRPRLGREGLLGETPRWGRFWEHPALSESQRQLVLDLRESLGDELRVLGENPRCFGLIHADLHPGNLLVTSSEPQLRLAAIDFDDAAFGWHMYDLAAALFEFQGAEDFTHVCDALFTGYRSKRPLAAEDSATLPSFLRLRALALIGWLYQRPDYYDAIEFARLLARLE